MRVGHLSDPPDRSRLTFPKKRVNLETRACHERLSLRTRDVPLIWQIEGVEHVVGTWDHLRRIGDEEVDQHDTVGT